MTLVSTAAKKFSGGTITSPLVIAPTSTSDVPLTINLPTGASDTGVNALAVHSNDLTPAGNLLAVDAFGAVQGRTDSVNLFGVFKYADTNGATQFVTGPGNVPAEGEFVLSATGQVVLSSGSVTVVRVGPTVSLVLAKHSAPADAALAAGECSLWFDQTNGAAKLMVKAKSANGTVVTGSLALA